jgi:hypothetical protein
MKTPRRALVVGAIVLAGVGPSAAHARGMRQCVVSGGDYGVDVPPYGISAGIGGYPTCDYVADARGGYAAFAASWEIDITKPNGTRTKLGPGPVVGVPAATCGSVGTVQVGDRVHVVLYTGAENAASVQSVKVRPTYHC